MLISAAIRRLPPDLPLAFEFLKDSQMDKVEFKEVEFIAANTSWSRPSYLARFQRFHVLSVGSVAKALSRTRLAAQQIR